MRYEIGTFLPYRAQDHAKGHTQRVNNLQLIFLVIEGFLVSSCTAACLIYLLRMASEQRYKLYDTFLAIPIGEFSHDVLPGS